MGPLGPVGCAGRGGPGRRGPSRREEAGSGAGRDGSTSFPGGQRVCGWYEPKRSAAGARPAPDQPRSAGGGQPCPGPAVTGGASTPAPLPAPPAGASGRREGANAELAAATGSFPAAAEPCSGAVTGLPRDHLSPACVTRPPPGCSPEDRVGRVLPGPHGRRPGPAR